MIIKVCGLKDPQNILHVLDLKPQYIGFIFYKPSPRYVGEQLVDDFVHHSPQVKRVGVFVNSSCAEITRLCIPRGIKTVQLSGAETVDECKRLQSMGFNVIKAFGIDHAFNFEQMVGPYEGSCQYFLFDTQSHHHGGSGKQFNWTILDKYKQKTPFLLSGGISIEDVFRIEELKHARLIGVDLNSKFELKPGIKDLEKLNTFFHHINC